MKSIMKKGLILLLCLTTAISMFACGKTSASKKHKIGIVMLVENGAFLDMKTGIMNELKDKGYTDENTTFDYQCAQGDTTNLKTICSSMDNGTYDLVFTIATPATQSFVNLNSNTPVFFCAVSSPVAAGVITDMNKPDKNATGTSNAIPVSDIFTLSDKLTPNCKTYGLIYCTSETNSVSTIAAAKKYMDSKGLSYVEASVTDSSEVKTAVDSLVGKVDAVFVPNDSVVQSAITSIVDVTREHKIPVYCSSATTVASGCFATYAIDDAGIGAKTADMAAEYLRGSKKIEDIPSVVVSADYISINTTTMKSLGITVPSDLGTQVQYLGN
jgi:putative ABC transport system substrate-binding protein